MLTLTPVLIVPQLEQQLNESRHAIGVLGFNAVTDEIKGSSWMKENLTAAVQLVLENDRFLYVNFDSPEFVRC